MASCYECIHCGACSDSGDSGFSGLKEDASKCKHFKVRCKACKYSEYGGLVCNHPQWNREADSDREIQPNGFCYLGEPKANNPQ